MIRLIIQQSVLLLILVVGMQTFVALGWLRPVLVSGGSMAPHYLGEHYQVECQQCEQSCEVDFDACIERCPLCGTEDYVAELRSGDRMTIQRWSPETGAPHRWTPIVIRSPLDARTLMVKRVIGLPGEQVAFQQGDVWIDGQRIVKTFSEQIATRIRIRSMSATDDLHWNVDLSRKLNHVDDLMVEFEIPAEDLSTWVVHFTGRQNVIVRIGQQVQVECGSEILGKFARPTAQASHWLISTFDGAVLIAADGVDLFHKPISFDRQGKIANASVQVFRDGVEIRELSRWRDIYYEAPQLAWRLGPDEWFVVGDNQARSIDSRNWDAPAGVPARLIVGRVN